MAIKMSIIAALICVVLGVTNNRGIAQVTHQRPALPQIPFNLHCQRILTDELACAPLTPPSKSSLLDQSLKYSPEAAGAAVTLYMANNVATKSAIDKWLQKFGFSKSLVAKLGPKIFSYSKSMPVKSLLGIAVVATGIAAIYEKTHSDDKSESDNNSALREFSISNNDNVLLKEIVHSNASDKTTP
jgi:hypothetical protein